MACCSSTKTEQLENKNGETAKAFAPGAKAFLNSPSCLTPEAALPSELYDLFHNHLGRRRAHFELRDHFLDFGRLLVGACLVIQTLPRPE